MNQHLRSSIPPARIARYDATCANTGTDPMDLYLWSGSVALAVFRDLSHVEVSMRSRMAEQLVTRYGTDWYRRTDILDSGTLKLIDRAWDQAKLSQLNAPADVIHGKLVASLMFGFWVKVLGRGSNYINRSVSPAVRERRIYDNILWKPALRYAFPNVGDVERAKVETAARRVQELRNRVAHHEHIVWGVPLPGERRPHQPTTRLPVSQAHDTLLTLAGYFDTGLETWLRHNTTVPTLLSQCPLQEQDRLLL